LQAQKHVSDLVGQIVSLHFLDALQNASGVKLSGLQLLALLIELQHSQLIENK
jgi:hypothetical protein